MRIESGGTQLPYLADLLLQWSRIQKMRIESEEWDAEPDAEASSMEPHPKDADRVSVRPAIVPVPVNLQWSRIQKMRIERPLSAAATAGLSLQWSRIQKMRIERESVAELLQEAGSSMEPHPKDADRVQEACLKTERRRFLQWSRIQKMRIESSSSVESD